jgi:hypothetical protein
MKKVNLAALTAGIVTTAFISPLAIGREAPADMSQGQRHGSVVNERQDRVYQNSHQQTQASMSGQYDHRSSYGMENTHTRTRPTGNHTDNSHERTRPTRSHTDNSHASTRTINDSRNSASTVRPDSFSERNDRTSASAARPDSSTERNYQPSTSAVRPDDSSELNYQQSISNGGLRETINNPDISSILEQERKRRRRAKKQKIRRKLERMMSEVGPAKKFRANLDSNSLGNTFGNSFR